MGASECAGGGRGGGGGHVRSKYLTHVRTALHIWYMVGTTVHEFESIWGEKKEGRGQGGENINLTHFLPASFRPKERYTVLAKGLFWQVLVLYRILVHRRDKHFLTVDFL